MVGISDASSPLCKLLRARPFRQIICNLQLRRVSLESAENLSGAQAAMAIALTDIPRIMTAQGWTTAAALMQHWFSLPGKAAPPFAYRNDTIVKMKWVLAHARAREVYDQLIRDRIWSNPAAQKQIRAMLKKRGLLRGHGACFGVFQSTQSIIDENAVNYRAVNQDLFEGLDDMAAALGNFTFHVQIGGSVERALNDKFLVRIGAIGIYIRDNYDFTGRQHLGFWNSKTNRVSIMNPLTGDRVSNADFRDWRARNNKGGDFRVYSDVTIISLSKTEIIEV